MKRILVFLSIIFLANLSHAQIFRGGIQGAITDPTGNVVRDATVTALATATQQNFTTTTSGAGLFAFADLPLGAYKVTVNAGGFQIVVVDAVNVSAGVIYNLPIQLRVAQQTTSVEVAAAGIALETSATSENLVIPTQSVQDIPINGRDFTQLTALAPGFVGYAGMANGSLNGTRANQINFQIEGVDNNDQYYNFLAVNQGGVQSIPGVVLPLDAVDQFSLQTQSSPETGRNPGGVVNLVIKSGTNQLHGSAYYYNRNELFAAESPFAPAGSPKNKLRNQQFGGSLGGPIVRNKTFFFGAYEGQKFLIGNQARSTEPSQDYQTEANALLNQYGVAANPVSENLLKTLWPTSALTGSAASGNYFNPDAESGYSHNGLLKIDHDFNENNKISLRGFMGQGSQTAPVASLGGAAGSRLTYYFTVAPIHIQNYSAIYNRVFSPHLTNQALFGVDYFNQVYSDFNHSFDPAALGLDTGVTNLSLSGAPQISITGFDSVGVTPSSGRNDITGHLSDTASYVLGRHDFRFGAEIRQTRIDSFYNTGGRGAFFFSGTQGPWSALLNTDGFDNNIATLADFLAGDVYQSTIVRGDQERKVTVNSFSLFAQDAWQLTRSLNVNYGLRYDYQGALHDDDQDLSTFIPDRGGLVLAGAQIASLYPADKVDLSPRVGFAWQPKQGGSTVLRGAFGVYFDTPALVDFLGNSSANNGPSGVEDNPIGANPVFTIQRNAYTIVNQQPVFPNASVSVSGNNTYNLFSVSQNLHTAYDYSYSLSLEQTLSRATIFQLAYVGGLGRKLLSQLDINQATLGSGFNSATVTGPNGYLFPYQQSTRPYFQQFPNYGVIDEIESNGNSNYNSLQATLRTVRWHGLTSQFGYGWSHSLDEVTAYLGSIPQNSDNFHGEYGNSDFDIRNHFTGYLNYAIPAWSFGPKRLSQGWEVNSLLSFHSGQPVTVHAGGDYSGTGENADRAVQIGNATVGVSHALVSHSYVQWLNPDAYTTPDPGTFSPTRRNQVDGPGYGSFDFSVIKDTAIKERVRAEFRAEFFNAFNRTNLAPPSGTLGGGFGQSSDTIGDYNGYSGIGPGEPFNTQFALKILF